jgi:hypothetical protein
VESPTASPGASIWENCDSEEEEEEEEGIFGGMTVPARMTVGGFCATEQAGGGGFFRLTVTRVQFLWQESKTRRPPP